MPLYGAGRAAAAQQARKVRVVEKRHHPPFHYILEDIACSPSQRTISLPETFPISVSSFQENGSRVGIALVLGQAQARFPPRLERIPMDMEEHSRSASHCV